MLMPLKPAVALFPAASVQAPATAWFAASVVTVTFSGLTAVEPPAAPVPEMLATPDPRSMQLKRTTTFWLVHVPETYGEPPAVAVGVIVSRVVSTVTVTALPELLVAPDTVWVADNV